MVATTVTTLCTAATATGNLVALQYSGNIARYAIGRSCPGPKINASSTAVTTVTPANSRKAAPLIFCPTAEEMAIPGPATANTPATSRSTRPMYSSSDTAVSIARPTSPTALATGIMTRDTMSRR